MIMCYLHVRSSCSVTDLTHEWWKLITSRIPIMNLLTSSAEEIQIQDLIAGIHDFLIKGFLVRVYG